MYGLPNLDAKGMEVADGDGGNKSLWLRALVGRLRIPLNSEMWGRCGDAVRDDNVPRVNRVWFTGTWCSVMSSCSVICATDRRPDETLVQPSTRERGISSGA
jgi:hypothetical protein